MFNARYAQSQHLLIKAGPSFAAGKYGSADITDNNAGLAEIGFCYSADFDILPQRHVTPTLSFFSNTSSMNTRILERLDTGVSMMTISGYTQTGGDIGVSFQTLNEGGNLFLGIALGFANFKSPELLYDYPKRGYAIKQKALDEIGYYCKVAAGIKYPVGERFTFIAGADFRFSGMIRYGTIKYNVLRMNAYIVSNNSLNIPYQLASAYVGIGYRLDKRK